MELIMEKENYSYKYMLKAIQNHYDHLNLILSNYEKGYIDDSVALENIQKHIEYNQQSIAEELIRLGEKL